VFFKGGFHAKDSVHSAAVGPCLSQTGGCRQGSCPQIGAKLQIRRAGMGSNNNLAAFSPGVGIWEKFKLINLSQGVYALVFFLGA